MTSPSLWIERGPNGRPYYVRRKSKQPSTWQLLTEALLPRSSRSLFTSRDSRQNNHVQYDPSERPLALPAPRSPTPQPAQTTNPPPIDPTSYAQPLPVNMYLVPPQQKRDRSRSKDKDKFARNSNGMPQPPQTFFAGLPPPAFPMQPIPGAAYPIPPFPQPLPFTVPPQPFPGAPPGAVPPTMPLQNQLAGPPNLPPQRVMAQGDLRYKCEVCGRFRSTRYHYKHPIPPGQLPGKTVCRRCRDEATDSEEETSSGSSRSTRRQHRARHDRSRNASSHRQKRDASRHRTQSGRRLQLLDNGRARYTEQYYSDSTSPSSSDRHYKDRDRRSRQPSSIHEEVVRHTRRLRLSPVEQRRIHFEDERREGQRHQDGESDSDVYEYETRRRIAGPNTHTTSSSSRTGCTSLRTASCQRIHCRATCIFPRAPSFTLKKTINIGDTIRRIADGADLDPHKHLAKMRTGV
ncbi:hypothetical protein EDD37DRAFT_259116 [Exophiala viscosa]|uniref:uncharacterized protein n=1 Tax=Exophiala viscosa TaxID=2486360 RepID=UPI0021A1791C|nr:hypothetical protein EDD37DRAFT_259116 [Exophiala viscosa]